MAKWLYIDKHQFCQSSQQSKNRPKLQGIQNVRDNQGTENSIEFFRGKALALETQSNAINNYSNNTNNYADYRLLKCSSNLR